MIRKDLIVVALATFCLTATVFMVIPTRSEYDPWADLKEDGTIDIYDAIMLANVFGTSGNSTKNVNVLSIYNDSWFGMSPAKTVTILKNLNVTFGMFLDIPCGIISVDGYDEIYCTMSIRLGSPPTPVRGGYATTGLIDDLEVTIPKEMGQDGFGPLFFENGTVTMCAKFPVCTPRINITMSLATDPLHGANAMLSMSLYLKND